MPSSRGAGRSSSAPSTATAVVPLLEIADEGVLRFESGLPLLDRVLGGGVVAGGATLLAGEPGIGKSTLLLHLGDALATAEAPVLYVSAEESARQLRLRGERLGCRNPQLLVAGETLLEPVLAAIEERPLRAVLVDSVQAIRSSELDSPPGSIGQVRHATDRLVEVAKRRHLALFLVGHVTKEGSIAGPKSLEHVVDTVLTFEGERGAEHRLLRAQKNRFGPTGEVAMFEMHDGGLVAVADPSRVLLALRRGHHPGSAVFSSLQGSRPLLVEVQALATPTAFPQPRRMSVGLDANRLVLLVAVLQRFAGLQLSDRDLFLNVVGGLALKEPAADLAVAAAIVSALAGRPLPEGCAFFGEVGLLGEVRPVSQTEARLREIRALGFERVVSPRLDGVKLPRGLRSLAVEEVGELAGVVAGG